MMENWSNISTEELNERTSQKPKLSLGGKIIVAVVLFVIIFLFLGAIASRPRSSTTRIKKYKKVIKKGLLWDTEYLIERD